MVFIFIIDHERAVSKAAMGKMGNGRERKGTEVINMRTQRKDAE